MLNQKDESYWGAIAALPKRERARSRQIDERDRPVCSRHSQCHQLFRLNLGQYGQTLLNAN